MPDGEVVNYGAFYNAEDEDADLACHLAQGGDGDARFAFIIVDHELLELVI